MNTTVSKQKTFIPRSQLLLFGLLLSSFIYAYFPVWRNLVENWSTSSDYSHGFFILPISLFFIWQKRKILSEAPLKPSIWGLAFIVFSLLLYLVAYFGEISTVASFSMVSVLAGLVIYFYGFKIFKELIFPFFILLFMIPVPSQIYSTLTIPLQLIVSKISAGISSFVGIPIYREGNILHLPERTLQVVQACSGLRSMISLLTLSAVFGHITLTSNLLRTLLFLSGVPAAIIVNIIRVLTLIVFQYYFGYDLSTGTLHTTFGVVIFILALLLIYTTKGVLAIWDTSVDQKSSS